MIFVSFLKLVHCSYKCLFCKYIGYKKISHFFINFQKEEVALHSFFLKIPYVLSCPSYHILFDLSRGVLPETLRREPYAVVDERCENTTLDSTTHQSQVVKTHRFDLFLDPCTTVVKTHRFDLFLDPSIYIVTLYEIVGGG